jgi:hypothetical protein
MKKNSPTQRSKAKMIADGWTVAITEKWNPFARVRQDLFGFIDILCLRGNELVGLQTTTGDNVSKRIDKIKSLPAAKQWLAPTRRIVVHGWRKVGAQGKRKLWECREVEVTTKDFEG